ncbi:MAG: hydrogenase expression/formation protein HypE [Chloroflexi bacterium]|nr:hydrogenase expression/formation protein HypE [Chloroflexota bacterium]
MITLQCPLPLRDYPNIVMGHGGGGKLSHDLVQHLFAPAFDNALLAPLNDQAVFAVEGARLAFTTDSFVVKPIFFPGSDIGALAVNGTVNDLAMSGARPIYLSAGFILEEGFALDDLTRVVYSMAEAAKRAGVQIITGDTKVVEEGHGDGIYINTAGIGIAPNGVNIAAANARAGDAIILSGAIGLHGIAILSQREGLRFDSEIVSDCAPLHDLVAAMLAVTQDIHTLRDPTRGGIASALNEIAEAAKIGIEIDERAIAVPRDVASACEMLGLDPFYVANEGKLIAFAPSEIAPRVVAALRAHPLGRDAAIIGRAVTAHPGMVVARTSIGATRVVDMMIGEQLPRIC